MANSLRVIFENFAHFYPRYMIFIRSDEITIRHQAKDGNKLYEYPYNFFYFLFQKILITMKPVVLPLACLYMLMTISITPHGSGTTNCNRHND